MLSANSRTGHSTPSALHSAPSIRKMYLGTCICIYGIDGVWHVLAQEGVPGNVGVKWLLCYHTHGVCWRGHGAGVV